MHYFRLQYINTENTTKYLHQKLIEYYHTKCSINLKLLNYLCNKKKDRRITMHDLVLLIIL